MQFKTLYHFEKMVLTIIYNFSIVKFCIIVSSQSVQFLEKMSLVLSFKKSTCQSYHIRRFLLERSSTQLIPVFSKYLDTNNIAIFS